MKYTDHHVHTCYSGDSDELIENAIKSAIDMGQSSFMITDHNDYDYPSGEFDFELNIDDYNKGIMQMQEMFPSIEIRKGIELGYQSHLMERLDNLVKEQKFDFVISSIHLGEGKDFLDGSFFKGRSQYESYLRYFESVLEMVECFSSFDVVGHLDFIVRYGDFANKSLKYHDFKTVIDKILKTVIKNEKGLELNTSGIRYGLNMIHPQEEILKKYYDLGGRIITVGSDAHNASQIQSDFTDAFNRLKKIGYTEVSSFKERKHKMLSIDQILRGN